METEIIEQIVIIRYQKYGFLLIRTNISKAYPCPHLYYLQDPFLTKCEK